MSSNAGQSPVPSKAVNISNSSATSTTFHSTAVTDSGSQRRPGGSGSFGAGLSSRNSATARNTQGRKSQHKRQRKPRILDDDEYSESVGSSEITLTRACTLTPDCRTPGRHEISKQPQRTNVHHPSDELLPPPSSTIPTAASQHPALRFLGSGVWVSCSG